MRPMLRNKLATVAVVTLALVASACQTMGAGTWRRIQGTTWHLSESEGKPALEGIEVVLELKPGRQLFGNGGVNAYFGTYEHDGSTFSTPRLASERKAGPPDAMRQEARYLGLLDRATSARVEEDALVLGADGTVLLRFVPGP